MALNDGNSEIKQIRQNGNNDKRLENKHRSHKKTHFNIKNNEQKKGNTRGT